MSNNSSLTEKVKLLGLVVLVISLFASCNSVSTNNSNNNVEINKQVFLMGNGASSAETIRELVDRSGIRKGGYVVIIPTSFNKNKSNAINLKNQFYFDKVTAVHILNFQSNSSIKKTDLLAIENASIIFILNGNRNKFMKLVKNSNINKSLHNAYNKGCLIAGVGNGSSVLGDYYYLQGKDAKTNKPKLWLKPGLGILENTVIDASSFLKEHRKEIKTKSSEKKFAFIGLDKNSVLWINNKNAMVISKSGISFLDPANPSKRYKYHEKFIISNQ